MENSSESEADLFQILKEGPPPAGASTSSQAEDSNNSNKNSGNSGQGSPSIIRQRAATLNQDIRDKIREKRKSWTVSDFSSKGELPQNQPNTQLPPSAEGSPSSSPVPMKPSKSDEMSAGDSSHYANTWSSAERKKFDKFSHFITGKGLRDKDKDRDKDYTPSGTNSTRTSGTFEDAEADLTEILAEGPPSASPGVQKISPAKKLLEASLLFRRSRAKLDVEKYGKPDKGSDKIDRTNSSQEETDLFAILAEGPPMPKSPTNLRDVAIVRNLADEYTIVEHDLNDKINGNTKWSNEEADLFAILAEGPPELSPRTQEQRTDVFFAQLYRQVKDSWFSTSKSHWKLYDYSFEDNALREYSAGSDWSKPMHPKLTIDILHATIIDFEESSRPFSFIIYTWNGDIYYLAATSLAEKERVLSILSPDPVSISPLLSKRKSNVPFERHRVDSLGSFSSISSKTKQKSRDPAILTVDSSGIIVEIDKATEKLTARSRTDLVKHRFSSILAEPFKSKLSNFEKSFVQHHGARQARLERRKSSQPVNITVTSTIKEDSTQVLYEVLIQYIPFFINLDLDTNVRKVNRLKLDVSSAKNLKPVKKYNPYCTVFLNKVPIATTITHWGSKNPYWMETFSFDLHDTFPYALRFLVQNNHTNVNESRSAFGLVNYTLNNYENQISDSFPITPIKEAEIEEDLGTLTIGISCKPLIVLPTKEFKELLDLLISDTNFQIALALAKFGEGGSQTELIAYHFLNLFFIKHRDWYMVKKLASLEISIANSETSNILFRGNSLATKTFDLFMKNYGVRYLHNVLDEPLRKVFDEKDSCEIFPDRLGKNQSLSKNQERLANLVKTIWDAILSSAILMPFELSYVFEHIWNAAEKKFSKPNEECIEKYIAVSGFFFLRFITPAILDPYLFGLSQDVPQPHTARTLTLIAKVMQNLANLILFGDKEPNWDFMNDFLMENIPLMQRFLRAISTPIVDNYQHPEGPETSLRSELSELYRICKSNEDKLKEHAETQNQRKIKELLPILKNLDSAYERLGPEAMNSNEQQETVEATLDPLSVQQ